MSKISELSDGGSLVSTDFLIAVRSGGNVKVQMDTINVDQVDLGDNEFIRLGNSQDLTLVHTSTQSIINQAGVGDLLIQKGAATKLTVNSSGIDVTGTATMDGLTVNSGTLDTVATFQSSDQFTDLELTDSGGTSYIRQSNGSLILEADRANASASSITLIKVDGAQVARFASGGDISFYEDTGTTAKLVWDASEESLGIGTSSPSASIDVVSSGTNSQSIAEFSSASGKRAEISTDAQDDAFMYLYDSADAAKVAFRTDGNDSYINGGGNVGIGTSSPAQALHVNSGASNEAARFESTDTEVTLELKDTTGTAKIKSRADFRFETGATPSEAMRIDSSGRVGIGMTANTGCLLNVNDHIRAENSAFLAGRENAALPAFAFHDDTDTGMFNVASNILAFSTAGSERMRIDSSGNVGIGSTNPSFATGSGLEIQRTTATATMRLEYTGSNAFELSAEVGQNTYNAVSSLPHVFEIGSVEKMRLDASGNLLVGKTATSFSLAGIGLMGNDQILATAASDNPLALNRLTTDGDIARFYKDSVQVGSIGTTGSNVVIGTGNTGLRFYDGGSAIIPHTAAGGSSNGLVDLGQGGFNEFKDLYLSGDITSSRFTTDGDGIKMEAGKGIKFSGYASANVLDDYEEGEFTLVLSGTVAAGTNAGGSRGGFYTKIGRLVTCQIMVANTELTNATGVLKFSGLPFTPAGYASRGFRGVVSTYGQNLFSPADGYFSPAIDIVNGSTDFYLIQTKDDGNWANVLVDNQSGLYFEGCVSYFTND